MKETQQDKDWLLYMWRDMTHVTVKYVADKQKGTNVDIYIPDNSCIYLPFIIRKLPVHIEKIHRRLKNDISNYILTYRFNIS